MLKSEPTGVDKKGALNVTWSPWSKLMNWAANKVFHLQCVSIENSRLIAHNPVPMNIHPCLACYPASKAAGWLWDWYTGFNRYCTWICDVCWKWIRFFLLLFFPQVAQVGFWETRSSPELFWWDLHSWKLIRIKPQIIWARGVSQRNNKYVYWGVE